MGANLNILYKLYLFEYCHITYIINLLISLYFSNIIAIQCSGLEEAKSIGGYYSNPVPMMKFLKK